MRLSVGVRLGVYEITGILGAGGMGEVYRARDTKLGREVAIKVLPERLARDATSLALFEREAQAVAALSHPNILAIHDFGESESMVYAVMELLQGETLRQRLKQGPIPARKAVEYSVQIAAALAAAHARGITHRDLKPENIFLTTDGHVKLLDFGLAVKRDAPSPLDDEGSSPTITQDLDSGSVVGTVGYMSPEQVRGAAADHRSDIFSLGCVLYEMLTGQRAFLRPTAAETQAAILRDDPPEMLKVRVEIPLSLERVVFHCLEKVPQDRFQSARDLAFDLQASLNASSSSELRVASAIRAGAKKASRASERFAWIALAVLVLVGGLTLWRYLRQPRSGAPMVVSDIGPPENTTFGAVALSPAGDRLAFVGWRAGRSQIWMRSLAALEQHPLASTDGGAYPFWSPDGTQLCFFADGKLKKIPASGGPAQIVAEAPAGRGGSWSDAGDIVFAPSFDLPLYRVPASGGTATPVTKLDASRGEISHRWPYFLPGGKKFLYFVFGTSQPITGIYLGSLDGKTRQFLVASGYGAAYVDPGYLLFTRGRALLAQRFDPVAPKLEGEMFTVADPIGVNELEYAHFSASASGNVLVYRRGGFFLGSELRWYSRSGQALGAVASTDRYWSTRMSPDGRSVAVEIQDAQTRANNIWIYDLAKNLPRRFTFNPTDDVSPIWSPDGRQIVYASRRQQSHYGLFMRESSGAGQEQALLQIDGDLFPQDWSRDGRSLLYVQLGAAGKGVANIWMLPMTGERKPVPLVQGAFNADYPRFSPNGRWVAYRSNETGHDQVYVIPTQGTGGKWQVSVDGGDMPVWSADGKELYYLSLDNRIMVVNVKETGSAFEFAAPQALFQAHVLAGLGNRFDPSTDGKRFLILIGKEENPTPVTLALNWASGLKP